MYNREFTGIPAQDKGRFHNPEEKSAE